MRKCVRAAAGACGKILQDKILPSDIRRSSVRTWYFCIGRISDSYWLYLVNFNALKSGSPAIWWMNRWKYSFISNALCQFSNANIVIMRGGREMENHFECLWDLFRSIPSIETPGVSVLDEYYWLNKHDPNYSKHRSPIQPKCRIKYFFIEYIFDGLII